MTITHAFVFFYRNDMKCSWNIQTIAGYGFQIIFPVLRLEESTYCTSDFVEIIDGVSPIGARLGKYCTRQYEDLPLMFTTNSLWIQFSTDKETADIGFAMELYPTVLYD